MAPIAKMSFFWLEVKFSEKKIKIYSKVVWYVKDDTLHLFDNNS